MSDTDKQIAKLEERLKEGQQDSFAEFERKILDVWGNHTEFSAKGNRYVCFVLQKQIDELVEEGFSDEAMQKELSDMVLVITRHFARQGQHIREFAEKRLESRHANQQESIKEKYLGIYENYSFPQEAQRKLKNLRDFLVEEQEEGNYVLEYGRFITKLLKILEAH